MLRARRTRREEPADEGPALAVPDDGPEEAAVTGDAVGLALDAAVAAEALALGDRRVGRRRPRLRGESRRGRHGHPGDECHALQLHVCN